MEFSICTLFKKAPKGNSQWSAINNDVDVEVAYIKGMCTLGVPQVNVGQAA